MKKEISIDITLNSSNDYRNVFNKDSLSDELGKYIYEECKGEPLNSNILLRVYLLFPMDKDEENEFVDMVRKNYGMEVKENLLFLRRSFIWKTIMFLLGTLFVAISYFSRIISDYIVSEVILIVGWVAIWESVYSFIFEDGKRKIEIRRLKKLANCRIVFEDYEK